MELNFEYWQMKGEKVMYDKSTRVLYMFQELLIGKVINKNQWLQELGIDNRTFERDIATLRAYLAQHIGDQNQLTLDYCSIKKGYVLNDSSQLKFSSEEVLTLTKILLGSRALCKEETEQLIKVMLNQLENNNRNQIQKFISNENHHFIPLRHNQRLINKIWDFNLAIEEMRNVRIQYQKANGDIDWRRISPVGMVFSDYYFYAISYSPDRPYPHPISYRLDRILDYEMLDEKFNIPYSKRFEAGEFKNQIQMMYQGELVRFTFEFTGHSIEAVLDKFPLSKIIEQNGNWYKVESIAYEQGLLMWILSQGEWIKVLSPHDLVQKVKEKLNRVINLY